MPPETIDHEARAQVAQAKAQIGQHEAICTERWETSRKALERVETGVNGLYKRWWAMAVALVSTLLTGIATVAALAFWLGAELAHLPGAQ